MRSAKPSTGSLEQALPRRLRANSSALGEFHLTIPVREHVLAHTLDTGPTDIIERDVTSRREELLRQEEVHKAIVECLGTVNKDEIEAHVSCLEQDICIPGRQGQHFVWSPEAAGPDIGAPRPSHWVS
jgi:hypothetical protein